jgi:hypothetical protein
VGPYLRAGQGPVRGAAGRGPGAAADGAACACRAVACDGEVRVPACAARSSLEPLDAIRASPTAGSCASPRDPWARRPLNVTHLARQYAWHHDELKLDSERGRVIGAVPRVVTHARPLACGKRDCSKGPFKSRRYEASTRWACCTPLKAIEQRAQQVRCGVRETAPRQNGAPAPHASLDHAYTD